MNFDWLDVPDVDLDLTLAPLDLIKAARLGDHALGEAQFREQFLKMNRDRSCELMIRSLARVGLARALADAYEREFPRHYPEDYGELDLSNVVQLPRP
jgi:hypothetical protein